MRTRRTGHGRIASAGGAGVAVATLGGLLIARWIAASFERAFADLPLDLGGPDRREVPRPRATPVQGRHTGSNSTCLGSTGSAREANGMP